MKNYFWNKIPLEYFFLVIGLYFGMRLVFVNPPWQTNDEDRHFYAAWHYANYYKPFTQGDSMGNAMPVNLYNVVGSFQGIRFNDQTKISKQAIQRGEDVTYNKSETFFHKNPIYKMNPIGYFPQIVGIKLGEFYKRNPIMEHWWGRSFGLFAYLVIVFFAIRIIPVYKNVLMLVALAPMALYQASSVTYDTLCNAATFLILAFVIKWLLQKEKVSTRELILFFAAFVIQIFSKGGYYFIPFLVLMIPAEKFNFSFPKIKLIAIALAVILLPSFTWDLYIKSFHFPVGIPDQNDFRFNSSENLAYNLQNIAGMISNLWNNILIQGKDWIVGCIGRFGYSYTPLPEGWIFIYVLILLVMAGTDHNSNFRLTPMQRGISAAVLLASLGVLIAGLYLVISPVGSNVIFGAQGRYFLPILPVVLFQLFGTIPNHWKKYLPLVTILVSIIWLYKTVGFIEGTFYAMN